MIQTPKKRKCRDCKRWRDPEDLKPVVVNWVPGWRCKDNCNASIEIMRKQREQREDTDGNRSI